MKIDVATKAIVDAWDAAWTALYGNPPTVSYTLDNEQFAEPNPEVPWVRLAIRHSTGMQITQGRPARYERTGHIMVQVFVPTDAGRQPMDVLVRQVIDSLETTAITVSGDTLTTLGAAAREAPADGQWSMCVVDVPFYYFESK